MKTFITLSFLALFSSAVFASEFQNSAAAFANKISGTSNQINEELSFVETQNTASKFYCNEIVVKLQPELGVSIAGVPGLKFAFNAEFTVTRPLPQNLELDKP
jgi:hypothetical protein